jgi:hypothetical protein
VIFTSVKYITFHAAVLQLACVGINRLTLLSHIHSMSNIVIAGKVYVFLTVLDV